MPNKPHIWEFSVETLLWEGPMIPTAMRFTPVLKPQMESCALKCLQDKESCSHSGLGPCLVPRLGRGFPFDLQLQSCH